jgi:phosphate transport system permease protein
VTTFAPDPVTEVMPAATTSAAVPVPDPDVPRVLDARSIDDRMLVPGALAGSLGLVFVVFAYLLPWSGKVGFVVCWWMVFLMFVAGLAALSRPWPLVLEKVMQVVISSGAALVGVALGSAVVYTVFRAHSALPHLNFYTHDMAGVRPTDPLDQGGVLHAMAGTVIEISIAVAVTVPLGIGTAVFMSEIGGGGARVVRTVVEAMTALPSIVAGLFVYTVVVVAAGFNRSGLAAAVAISVMILPIIARSADISLRIVPGGLREASLALGSSQWQTIWRVVLPTARPGLATAVILGIARGVGETSPVLLTSGASTFLSLNPAVGAMNSLPLYVFSAVRSGQDQYVLRGFGAAAVLLVLVLVLFVAMRLLARQQVSR